MATDTENPKTLEANPKKTLDAPDPPTGPFLPAATGLPEESQNGSSLPPSANGDQKEGKESKSRDSEGAEAPAVASPVGSCDAPVSNMQKKIRRAERFGMPVQLSEEEKRSSRAERFGTASTMHGSDALKKSEDQKRKARAERFGLPAKPTADEELKKKARLARFAQASKTDSVEEDKRKARAARFSVPTTSPVPQVNVKGDVEPAAVLGKASGGV